MMNVVALCLVLTTLVTAGVWSPTPPENQNPREDVVVKEGHRVVVVEFEKDDGNTKVSISPQEAHQGQHKSSGIDGKGYVSNVKEKLHDVVEDAKEKLKEASYSMPNVGQGISTPHKEEQEQNGHGYPHRPSARELVCDAFGKCEHGIGSALGKTKEVVSEKAWEAADKVYEVEEDAKEAVSEAVGKVKDSVTHKSDEASDVIHGAKEKAKDAASREKDTVEGGAKEAAEKAKRVASKTKEAVEDRAKEMAENVIDTTKTIKGDVKRNASMTMDKTKGKVSKAVEDTEEMVENEAEQVKHGADRIKEEGKRELKEILGRGREVLYDVFAYALSPESMGSYMGILHLLGFATAYGMCVWVTFLSSHVLAGSLPRQQFALAQSKIYPVYFKAMAYSVGMALLSHLYSQRKKLSMGTAETFQGFNLLTSLVMILVNFLYLEPRASKVMFERLKWEKEEGRGVHEATTEPSTRVVDSFIDPSGTSTPPGKTAAPPGAASGERPLKIVKLSETLRKLNSYSSFLNVLTLMGLTWHLVHTGQRLNTAC